MAFPSVTYTFANSTTADATQVNQNFTDLINGMSDGTKNFNISAITAAGTATLTGSLVLGLSLTQTFTLNGSMASDIAVSLDNTYNLGAAASGWKSLYLGNSAKTVRLMAPSAMAASWTFTYPTTAGTSGYIMQTDGSGQTTWVPFLRSNDNASNFSISASAGSSQLTITLNAADGTAPSASNPIDIVFRSGTATTGTAITRRVSAALTLVLSSGATLGLTTSQNQYVWLYAIDFSSGTIELAASGSRVFDEGSLYTTTVVSGSATDSQTLYSTSGRSSVPIRLLGRIKVNEASFWASNPTEISTVPANTNQSSKSEVRLHTMNGHGSSSTKIRRFTTAVKNVGTAITYADSATLGATFTINEDGNYMVSYTDTFSGQGIMGLSLNSSELTTSIHSLVTVADRLAMDITQGTSLMVNCAWQGNLKVGDIIRAHTDGSTNAGSTDRCHFTISKASGV